MFLGFFFVIHGISLRNVWSELGVMSDTTLVVLCFILVSRAFSFADIFSWFKLVRGVFIIDDGLNSSLEFYHWRWFKLIIKVFTIDDDDLNSFLEFLPCLWFKLVIGVFTIYNFPLWFKLVSGVLPRIYGYFLVCNFNLKILSLWTTESKFKLFEKEMVYGALLFHAPLFVRGLQGKQLEITWPN